MKNRFAGLGLIVLLCTVPFGRQAVAGTYSVNNAADSGLGSLRWAIDRANQNAGPDQITFDGSYTIYPLIELPPLNDTTGGTTIDGGNNTVIIDGSGVSTLKYGMQIISSHNTLINLHIRSIKRSTVFPDYHTSGFGVNILGNSNIIYGCKIYLNEYSGILLGVGGSHLTYPSTQFNKIQACYIGSSDGVTPGEGNKYGGIFGRNVQSSVIGVDGDGINDENEGNVISGNGYPGGIYIEGKGGRISGNYIGTDKTGSFALPNTGISGIAGAGDNAIIGTDGDGVSDDLEGNIISGNQNCSGAVRLSAGARFSGNLVGVDATGAYGIPNDGWGVRFPDNSTDILVGTNSDGISDELERNVISGSRSYGLGNPWSGNGKVTYNNVRISGNYIGTDSTGTVAIGNGAGGILLGGSSSVNSGYFIIGTDADGVNDEGERNVVSGNASGLSNVASVTISYDLGVKLSGNYIGTDVTGTVALPDAIGVTVGRSSGNVIGTDGDGVRDEIEGNIIVGKAYALNLTGSSSYVSSNNTVAGNLLGTDRTGMVRLGSGAIFIALANNNIIGTNGDGISDELEGNVIAGGREGASSRDGIYGAYSMGNRISGNLIGLAADGITPMGFIQHGLLFNSNMDNNIIGTNGDGISDDLEGNVIAGGGGNGCGILLNFANNNIIAGNFIGTDATESLVSGFGSAGINISYGDNNRIGTDWNGISDGIEGNVIANNGASPFRAWLENDGVAVLGKQVNRGLDPLTNEYIYETHGISNTIQGNSIYQNIGRGIDLIDLGNQQFEAPVIDSATLQGSDILVTGTAPAGSLVEVFVADNQAAGGVQGKFYKGRADAIDGTFSLSVLGVSAEDPLTATATDINGNTSEFSEIVDVGGNRPPELVPIGDKNVDEMMTLVFAVSAIDPDGGPVVVTASKLPDGAMFDGDAFSWTPDYTQAGSYQVTFVAADDKGTTDTETITITVNAVNLPPTVVPSGSGSYTIQDEIILGAEVSDVDGDLLQYEWSEDGTILCSGTIGSLKGGSSVFLPECIVPAGLQLGQHLFALNVKDGYNDPVLASIDALVQDRCAPTLAPVIDKSILWPPNKEMIEVVIEPNVVDDSDCVELVVEVSSNEPEAGLSSADMGPDFTAPVIDPDTGLISLQLRAERDGHGDGRIYTIVITAIDCAGNSSTASLEVVVPHDKRYE